MTHSNTLLGRYPGPAVVHRLHQTYNFVFTPTDDCLIPMPMPILMTFVLCVIILSSAPAAEPAAAKTPVILDTDIGDDIDDTWALAMLLKSPVLDLKLVTTTCGKAEYRAKLLAKLLTIAGRASIPIGLGGGGRDGSGPQQPWVEDYKLSGYRGRIHQNAADAIVNMIRKSPQTITVISIGPSHTLAAALKKDPGIAAKAMFVGMQGSVFKGYDGGPVSPEYNVKANVAAAQTVLGAPWKKITITPLDTCGLVTLSGERFRKLAASKDPLVKALLENYRIWAKKARVSELHSSSVLYDTVAVYLASADTGLLRKETLAITVTNDGFTKVDPKGTSMSVATAWKDLDGYRDRLVQVLTTPRVSKLTVTNEPVCDGTISPYQCGQFIEYLCGLTPSMFAEQVFDGSFEGVPSYRFEFRKETDRLEKPWYPDGAVHRGDFALDPVNPFNGKVAQRITQKPGNPCTLGVSQAGKHVKTGQRLRCSLFLRSRGLRSPVEVALWGQGQTYASATFRPVEQWQRFETVLDPKDTDSSATLSISFRGPGTLWIDQVSLMSVDNVFGWRRDVAEALKALHPGIIRFGGITVEGFDWTATIGDAAKRVPFTTYWGGLEPGNAGLEEFVQLCHWVDAEPLICVRFSGRTPKQAAEEVEYFNGPPTTPMGGLRARNGHPAAYGVRYWQIGNELGDESYQKGVADFCKAMKAVDPGIKLLAAFPSAGLLQRTGPWLDYICPHHYECQNLAAMEKDVARCRDLIAQNAPDREIRLGITEWNTTGGDWGLRRAMLWSLDNALSCSRYQNFMHRHCDLIEIANRSNLTDSFCSGILQTSGTGLFKTPTYYIQQLYAAHAGARPLKIRTDGPERDDSALDSSATLSRDGRTIAMFAVNATTEPQLRAVDFAAFAPLDEKVRVWTLADTLRRRARRRERLASTRPHSYRIRQHRDQRREARIPLPASIADRP